MVTLTPTRPAPGGARVASDAADGPPHPLRDLTRRQRWFAAVMVVMLLVPFGVGLYRAAHGHWLPSGDNALIALRTRDVFSHHPPLVGQPSTAAQYVQTSKARHPGPIEFYAMAL